MSGIITFLSDFGEKDWFVAAVKGEILKINNRAVIVDVTHQISSYDILSASFLIKSFYKDFPEGTVHLAVVDPGVGGQRLPIIVESSGYYFVGPDNGIFSYIYDNNSKIYQIKVETTPSSTFHARDIFGPTAARLSKGLRPADLGREIEDYVRLEFPEVKITGKRIDGEVVYIDKFGNLITNIPVDLEVEKFYIGTKEINIRGSYSEAGPREVIGIKGSCGFYEISVNQGSVVEVLGARIGMAVQARLKDK